MGVTHLKPWPKGVSGNPGGRPKLPPELKLIRSLTRHEINKLISKYGRMTMAEVAAALCDPSKPMIETAICKVFLTVMEDDDNLNNFKRLQFLLTEACGPAEKLEIEDDDDAERDELRKKPLKELLQLAHDNLPTEATEGS